MTGILAEIIEYKRAFVEESKNRMPLGELEHRALESPHTRDFAGALRQHGPDGCALIAEIKTASPSKGVIRDDVTVEEVARIYEENGAACISVLTDEKYFRGGLDRLGMARSACGLPLLRKDFIIDPYQIFEARVAGADAVLLIAACLDDHRLNEFMAIASLLNMDYLLEVHDAEEMGRAAALSAHIIGINNRDLATFKTELETTGRLARYAPRGTIVVSESGINSADDVRKVRRMGATAVLVGEALMRERDMGAKVRELAEAIKESPKSKVQSPK
ncbi:MAG: indole-3-glycerol phosphate synthase TrpC [Candidatus Latescibacterota bacterium]